MQNFDTEMKYNKLGSTDIDVSVICLGTMTFGEQNTEEEGFEQLNYALDNGVNFIDTAEMYSVPGREETTGSTERIIGNWLEQSGKRSEVILATKVTGPSASFSYIAPNLGFSRDRIFDAVTKSLRRLKTDYIDLYQLHWPERNANYFGKRGYEHDDNERWKDNFEEAIDTLNVLVKSGKIRNWGLSNETPWGVMRTREVSKDQKTPQAVSIQNPYNLLNRTYEVGMAEISCRSQMGLLAYSPLGFGRLTDKYHNGTDAKRDRINKFSQLSRYNSDNSKRAASLYYELAQKNGMSLAQMSLAFINSRPFVTSNIIGATTMEQLKENIATGSMNLSQEIIGEIEKIHETIPNPAP